MDFATSSQNMAGISADKTKMAYLRRVAFWLVVAGGATCWQIALALIAPIALTAILAATTL